MKSNENAFSTIEIKKVGITSTGAQAVVNAANKYLQMGGGVCGFIFRAAGPERLQRACDAIGGCRTGSAVITPGFDLCEYIIHAVGPIYQGGNHHEAEDLYSCYKAALDLAREREIRSIAFPLISSGIYAYPREEAWRVALNACRDWMKENEDYNISIVFAVIEEDMLEMGKRVAGELNIKLIV